MLRVLAMPPDRVAAAHEVPGLEFRVLGEEQALAWCADPELELDAARVRAAYARGDLCVGVTEGAQPVGYLWYAFAPTPHLAGVWVDCGPQARYSYKAFVRRSHRGRGIAPALYRRAHALCPSRGRAVSLLAIDLDNRASLRASLAAGRTVVGYAGFALFRGRLLFAFRSPGARRQGFRFFAAAQRPAGGAAGLWKNCQSL